MEADIDNNGNKEPRSAWYESAVRSALTAGAFSLIVAAVLVANHVVINLSDPLDSRELAELRETLHEQPDNDAVKEQIRELDLELRKKFFRRQRLAGAGRYLLLGGLVVFLSALKVVSVYRKKLPMPGKAADVQNEEERVKSIARYSVAVLGAALGGLALFLVTTSEGIPISERIAGDQKPVVDTVSWPSPEEIGKNWPRFRGPGGLGISAYDNVPASWNGETGEGILWKVRVPLEGASSPIVWGDRLFLTGANEKTREVYCFDTGSGELLWRRRVEVFPSAAAGSLEVWDAKTYAASTPVTDGRHVYAVFANGDLICLDFEGNEVWKKSLWPIKNGYGHAASLEMYRNLLLVLLDQVKADDDRSRSKLIAFDAATGRTVWETPRPVRDCWTTPIVINAAGRDQIITSSVPWVIAHDAETGAEIWKVDCLKGDLVPSPIYANGLVFATMELSDLTAIKPDGQGDVTETHVAWTAEGDFPSICSPVSDGKLLFLVSSAGTMTCWDTDSGKMVWEDDIEISVVASPTLVGDRIYMIGDDGEGVVVRASSEYEEIARSALGEYCQASPAFMHGRIYIRGSKEPAGGPVEEHLFCIGEK